MLMWSHQCESDSDSSHNTDFQCPNRDAPKPNVKNLFNWKRAVVLARRYFHED